MMSGKERKKESLYCLLINGLLPDRDGTTVVWDPLGGQCRDFERDRPR